MTDAFLDLKENIVLMIQIQLNFARKDPTGKKSTMIHVI